MKNTEFSHVVGNSKKNTNFLPSAPSLFSRLKEKGVRLKDVLVESRNEPVQFQPRNENQVSYFKSIQSDNGHLWKDEFLGMHELAYVIPGFIWFIATYPDTVVVCGSEFFVKFFSDGKPSLLSYDTTFNLGDFYVSVLVAQFEIFQEKPTLPIAFLIHDRKFENTHNVFFLCLKKLLKNSGPFSIVTDGEAAVTSAIQNCFKHWNLVSCWNHILIDVEVWLKKRGIVANEIAVYKSAVRELLQCQNVEEQCTKLSTLRSTWPDAFREYYDKFLSKRVSIGSRYHLEELQLTQESVTNNISEAFNNVLKRHQDWQEVTIDKMVFVLHQLQVAYKVQVVRSANGFGPFTLNPNTFIGMYYSVHVAVFAKALSGIFCVWDMRFATPNSTCYHACK